MAGLPKDRPVILLSGCNDAGICLQSDHHPNEDLFKLAMATHWREISSRRDRYCGVQIGPACTDNCMPAHKYSVRTERYTWATFDAIPDNVKWYSTNLNIYHPRMRLLPFGMNDEGDGREIIKEFAEGEKTFLLYLNFQNYSMERINLKHSYRGYGWATLRQEVGLPYRQFISELASHKLVLCPAGNGLDCYRVWESLYVGSYPVVKDSPFARQLRDLRLPVIIVDDLALEADEANDLAREMDEAVKGGVYSTEAAYLEFWERQFEN